jgi:hypothetical protein
MNSQLYYQILRVETAVNGNQATMETIKFHIHMGRKIITKEKFWKKNQKDK